MTELKIYTEQEKNFLIKALELIEIEYTTHESTEGIAHTVFSLDLKPGQKKPLAVLLEYNYNKNF